jgi:hypothetical protein
MRSLFKILIRTFFVVILLIGAVVSYILLTKPGSTAFLKFFVKQHWNIEYIQPSKETGNLAQGLELNNIEFKQMEWLPTDMSLRIQKLNCKFSTFGWREATINIENARLGKPQADPIVTNGYYKKGTFKINIFSNGVNVNDLEFFLNRFGLEKYKQYLEKGKLGAFDITLEGNLDQFSITGQVKLEEYVYKDFSLKNAPFQLDVKLKNEYEEYIPEGEIVLANGKLTARKTNIELKESRLIFSLQQAKPQLVAQGESEIGKTKIHIYVKGPVDSPSLELSSDPPFSQDKLLLMLATNKSWDSLDNSLVEQKLSTQAIGDVIDYFVLGGSGGSIAKKLGIKDVWFNAEGGKNTVGIKKEIISTLDLGYEVQQTKDSKDPNVQDRMQQKLLGDVDLNKYLTFSVEKELQQKQQEDLSEPLVPEDKVLLKYKSSF